MSYYQTSWLACHLEEIKLAAEVAATKERTESWRQENWDQVLEFHRKLNAGEFSTTKPTAKPLKYTLTKEVEQRIWRQHRSGEISYEEYQRQVGILPTSNSS